MDNESDIASTKTEDRIFGNTLPILPVNLSDHKLTIFLHWLPIVFTSGILPLVLYFALWYGTSLDLTITLTIPLVIMGVVSLASLFKRTWALSRKNSTCRPLGVDRRWTLDYFNWNFLFGFIVLTIIISVGFGVQSLHMASLPLSILMLYICLQMLIAQGAMVVGLQAPFRISSIAKRQRLRPGTWAIADDVVAVDGGLGREWRRAWAERYECDVDLRILLRELDLIWGASGLCVVVVFWSVVFGVDDGEVGYGLGWGLPWVWAGVMTMVTILMAKRMLRRQRRRSMGHV